jgi:hypothetical protein
VCVCVCVKLSLAALQASQRCVSCACGGLGVRGGTLGVQYRIWSVCVGPIAMC